jgi:alkylation response protein AidB-like acyl-CoA dehydrogenase
MDMELRDEQRQLVETARRFMQSECPPDVVRELENSDLGFSAKMWRRMADLGWLGLPISAEYGGFDLGVLDVVLLTKELGRALCPSPYISTVILSAGAIGGAGTNEQKAEYLPGIMAGEMVIAFALQEADRFYDHRTVTTRAAPTAGGWVLTGRKLFVEFAEAADALLVVARTGPGQAGSQGLTMFLVDPNSPNVQVRHLPTMARDRQFEVTFEDLRLPHDAVIGSVGDAWTVLERVIQRGALAFCGYLVGAAERMHELATDYAKNRVQFGRPIGSFQLIQSYLAQLIIEIFGAETLTYFAAWTLDHGRPSRALVAKTKAFVGDTLKRTTDVGSQVFGGIGYIEGVDSTLYLRRGKQYQLSLGATTYWEEIVAEELLDA